MKLFKTVLLISFLALSTDILAQVKMIFGDDFGRGANDSGAFMLNHFQIRGELELLTYNLKHYANVRSVPDATRLYSELLSKTENHSMVVVAVGPLFNIRDLLKSQTDSYFNLNGMVLVRQKVKEIAIMGRNFPNSQYERNFNGNMLVTFLLIEMLLRENK